MPPRKSGAGAAPRGESAGMETQTASQENEMKNIHSILQQRNKRVKQRRDDSRDAIVAAHGARVEAFRREVATVFEEHDKRIRAIRRPKLQRLIDLIRRKRELEERTEKCQSELRAAIRGTARQLQVVVEDRAEDASK